MKWHGQDGPGTPDGEFWGRKSAGYRLMKMSDSEAKQVISQPGDPGGKPKWLAVWWIPPNYVAAKEQKFRIERGWITALWDWGIGPQEGRVKGASTEAHVASLVLEATIPVDLSTPERREQRLWERATRGKVVDPIYAQISEETYKRAASTTGWNSIVLEAVGYMSMLLSKGYERTRAIQNFDASISISGKVPPTDLAEKAWKAVQIRYGQLEPLTKSLQAKSLQASASEDEETPRKAMIQVAVDLPKESDERRTLLAVLKEAAEEIELSELSAERMALVKSVGVQPTQVWEGIHGTIADFRAGEHHRFTKHDMLEIVQHRLFRWFSVSRSGFSIGM